RCDDCESDVRVELDVARALGARSTVLVPLRGRHEPLGVLQAFSSRELAFTDHDVRCFDLFGELVLSALRPEDQDRRIHWLTDVAGEVLRARPAVLAVQLPSAAKAGTLDAPLTAAVNRCATQNQEPTATTAAANFGAHRELEQASDAAVDLSASPSHEQTATTEVHFWASHEEEQSLTSQKAAADEGKGDSLSGRGEESERLTWPVADAAGMIELPEPSAADEAFEVPLSSQESARSSERWRFFSFPHHLGLPGSSRPGLNVVMGLVAVAALFSAGAWWGMQGQGKMAVAKVAAAPRESTRVEAIETSLRS